MPTPNADESRDEFVERCIPVAIEDGTAENPDQAIAICNSMWEDAQKGLTIGGLIDVANQLLPQTLLGPLMRHGTVTDLQAVISARKKDMSKNMERKTFPGMVVKADEDQGIVDAFFAIFGNVDEGQDVMHPGAFAKTFSERGNKVRVLDNHRTDSIMRAIGKPVMLKEVSRDELPGDLLLRHPDATGGAFASIQMLMDTPEGRGAFVRLRDKAITEWSFGYDPIGFDFDTRQDNGREVNVRNLREVKLYEISPVLFAMNEATTTVGAKGVSGATNLPIGDRGRAWDATAAVRRVRDHTGSDEEPSRSYRNAFFWFDSDAPENFGSYKLPFADVVDGTLTAIPRGVFAGAQRLDGTDIPEADKDGVRGRMTRYYTRMREQFDDDGIVPPWEKSGDDPDEFKIGRAISAANMAKIQNVIDGIQSQLVQLERMLTGAQQVPDDEESDDKAGPDNAPPPNARPDDAPPTEDREKALRELYIMAAEMQLSEV